MTNRYIISTDTITAEQEKEVIEAFKKLEVEWWHWLPNFWLVVDLKGNLKAKNISNRLREILPKQPFMIFEYVQGGSWVGAGPEESLDWVKSFWFQPDDNIKFN